MSILSTLSLAITLCSSIGVDGKPILVVAQAKNPEPSCSSLMSRCPRGSETILARPLSLPPMTLLSVLAPLWFSQITVWSCDIKVAWWQGSALKPAQVPRLTQRKATVLTSAVKAPHNLLASLTLLTSSPPMILPSWVVLSSDLFLWTCQGLCIFCSLSWNTPCPDIHAASPLPLLLFCSHVTFAVKLFSIIVPMPTSTLPVLVIFLCGT